MSTRYFTSLLLTTATFVAFSSQALAVPTQMVHMDTAQCDPLSIPTEVHEIGHQTEFPMDESLFPTNLGQTPFVPCTATNDPNSPEVVIDIRNTSGRVWEEVWYVADPETTITNYDGEANDFGFSPLQEAFRIDNDVSDPNGSHHPLISESMTPDGIWEIGESWQFVLQDYFNSQGLPPEAITSIGVGNASAFPTTGIIDSSGSIIAVTKIPEPATAMLLVLGLLGTVARRRLASK